MVRNSYRQLAYIVVSLKTVTTRTAIIVRQGVLAMFTT